MPRIDEYCLSMKWKTKSSRDWDIWLRDTNTSREEAARALECSVDTVTKLRYDRRPGWDLAARIESYTNGAVAVGGWAKTPAPYIPPTPTSAVATEPEGANP